MIENTSDKHKISVDSALNIQQRRLNTDTQNIQCYELQYNNCKYCMDCGAKFNPGVSKNNLLLV